MGWIKMDEITAQKWAPVRTVRSFINAGNLKPAALPHCRSTQNEVT